MSGAGKRWLRLLLSSAMLVPLMCRADPVVDVDSASAPLHFVIMVRPIFRITRGAPVTGGHESRIWTNMKVVRMASREYTFRRIAEATLFVPSSAGRLIVHGW